MRQPKALSHSSLSLWEKDRDEFFLRHLAETRAPRLPQEVFASVGSAFDAYAKSALHERVFGPGADSNFAFDKLFVDQVEQHNRDWAREHGKYIFECYVMTGAFDELLQLLLTAIEPPKFESKVDGIIDGIPLTGKPDLRFVIKPLDEPLRVVLDWKVKGYCSKYTTSPSKGYALCRDGYDGVARGVDKTKAAPNGKQSRSHNSSHDLYLAFQHRGLTINQGYMEDCNSEYADQLSLYGWLLGERVGDEHVVTWIDEIVAKPVDVGNPLLRIANHRARVRGSYQSQLLARARQCWECILSGHVFTDMTREDSDQRCHDLQQMSIGLQPTNSSSDEERWYNEVVRPKFRR